jgi:O-antigen ligase
MYWGFLLPVAAFLVLLYFYSLDKVLLLVVFLTPLAVNYKDYRFNIGASIPTEPLLVIALGLVLLRSFYHSDFDKKLLHHPMSYVIYFSLFWMLMTTITSEIPLVSAKYLLSRLWFVVPMYFLMVHLFQNRKKIKLFIWLYTIPLLIVIGYTIYNHALWGFEQKAGHWVMTPFYNDHTAYGAILAMFIPAIFGLLMLPGQKKGIRFYILITLVILLVALALSYSRAAWLSFAFVIGILVLVVLKIRVRTMALSLGALLVLFFTFQTQIFMKLEKNKQDSSSDILEHVQSISNISSDASNLERINRWKSAFRMFRERPIMGWGPGTYQFIYAPFQNSQERTIISTNAGDLGNAHSEYIGPLSESGILGMLSFLAIAFMSIYTGFKVFRRSADRSVRILALSITLGLITYYIHGLLNNFLDSDKASVPFWGFIAILVALDLYHSRQESTPAATGA